MTFSPPAPRDRVRCKQGHDGEGRGDASSLMPSISLSSSTVGRSCREAAGMILVAWVRSKWGRPIAYSSVQQQRILQTWSCPDSAVAINTNVELLLGAGSNFILDLQGLIFVVTLSEKRFPWWDLL